MLPDFLVFKRRQVGQRLTAEDVLVGIVIPENRLAARGITEDADHVVFDRIGERQVGVVAGREAPQIAHVDNGEVPSNVSGIYFRELEGLVVDQSNRIRPCQTQFGIRRDLNRNLTAGAFLHPGYIEGINQLAGPQRTVDTNDLQGNRFLRHGGRSFGRLFAHGGRRRGCRFATAARSYSYHEHRDGTSRY